MFFFLLFSFLTYFFQRWFALDGLRALFGKLRISIMYLLYVIHFFFKIKNQYLLFLSLSLPFPPHFSPSYPISIRICVCSILYGSLYCIYKSSIIFLHPSHLEHSIYSLFLKIRYTYIIYGIETSHMSTFLSSSFIFSFFGLSFHNLTPILPLILFYIFRKSHLEII